MPTVRLEDDVYATVLQIAGDLQARDNRKVSMSEAIRMLITFCPSINKARLAALKRLY